jgi:hypothetical protein
MSSECRKMDWPPWLYKFKLHEFGYCDRSMPHMGMIICRKLVIHGG